MESLLRHTLATLAYRLGKVLRDAPADFGSFQSGDGRRTPVQILAHIGDLMVWAGTMVEGKPDWHAATPQSWRQEVQRFFAAIEKLDTAIAAKGITAEAANRLFQGPISDALTHTGQLSLLRGLAGSPVKGENYFMAEIVAGRVGPDQAQPHREF